MTRDSANVLLAVLLSPPLAGAAAGAIYTGLAYWAYEYLYSGGAQELAHLDQIIIASALSGLIIGTVIGVPVMAAAVSLALHLYPAIRLMGLKGYVCAGIIGAQPVGLVFLLLSLDGFHGFIRDGVKWTLLCALGGAVAGLIAWSITGGNDSPRRVYGRPL